MSDVDPKRLLTIGAATTALGIAIAGTAPILGTAGASRTLTQEAVGGVVLLVGWATLAWGIHLFGRKG